MTHTTSDPIRERTGARMKVAVTTVTISSYSGNGSGGEVVAVKDLGLDRLQSFYCNTTTGYIASWNGNLGTPRIFVRDAGTGAEVANTTNVGAVIVTAIGE